MPSVFACTLANLTPLILDARGGLPASAPALVALADALTSRAHRDIRVFDIHLRALD